MNDKQWLTNRYPKATGAEIEAFVERVAIMVEGGWSASLARIKASEGKRNEKD